MATITEFAQKMLRGEALPPPIGRLLGFALKVVEPGRAPYSRWRSTAEAKVVKAGSTLGYVECDVTDQNGKLVAKAASTCIKLRQNPTS